jgi:hypothetical protein
VGALTAGLDLGQRRDPSAIAVVEQEWRARLGEPGRDDHYLVRHLERLPLGTSYPAVARRMAAIVTRLTAQTGTIPTVYVDATGLGQPVCDLLRAEGVAVTACYFTHGDRRTVEGSEVRLGKAYLVSRLQALLQSARLHLPRTTEAEVLARELLDYEIRVSENANDTYGAFRVGSHDDLVTALGLAVQVTPEDMAAMAAGMQMGLRYTLTHGQRRQNPLPSPLRPRLTELGQVREPRANR